MTIASKGPDLNRIGTIKQNLVFNNPLGLVTDAAILIKEATMRGSKVPNAPKTYVINKKNHILAELFKGKDVKAVST